jgi:hypothetical protein
MKDVEKVKIDEIYVSVRSGVTVFEVVHRRLIPPPVYYKYYLGQGYSLSDAVENMLYRMENE